jgi:hypothetical protein
METGARLLEVGLPITPQGGAMSETVPTTDDLLEQARARLQELEQEEDQHGGELGERIDLAEQESFVGRWRGAGVMRGKSGDEIDVYLFWDKDDGRRFHYRNTRLVWEIDELKPTIGDRVAIVRGTDLPAEAGKNPTKRFAVRVQPSSDPLPEGEGSDDDLPF